jgi:hypothetical protein
MKSHTALVVDRSFLAANMYRLLMEPIDMIVYNSQSLEDVPGSVRLIKNIDLVVMSSNVFSDRLEQAVELISANERLMLVTKMFLLRESEIQKGWDQHLVAIPNSFIMGKPFHPDEFALRVKRLLAL